MKPGPQQLEAGAMQKIPVRTGWISNGEVEKEYDIRGVRMRTP
jgi:hypothetical protein